MTCFVRLCWMSLLSMAAVYGQSRDLNVNLVVNGDAEAGAAVSNPTDPQIASIPGWTTTGGFSVGSYGSSDFPSMSDYGPVLRGKHLFYGGPGNKRSTAVQTVDLSTAAVDIDAGVVKFYLSGY